MVRLVQLLITTGRAVAIVCNSLHRRNLFIECQLQTNAHMAKASALSVRVTDQVKAAVEKAAADDSRSTALCSGHVIILNLKGKELPKAIQCTPLKGSIQE